ncbi:MAG: type VII toxin-antitoxin system MntA family adenylyltransferase antitoxin [Anaerolineae bacterium]
MIIDLEGVRAYLAAQPDIVVSYLFGSVAREQVMPWSDVDVAVLLDPNLDERARVERQLALMSALEAFADREVQVTLLNDAPPLLAYQVIRDGVRLSARTDGERVAFEVAAMKRYFDLQPMLAFHKQALFQRIREVGLGRRARGDRSAVAAAERLRARLEGSTER